MRRVPYSDTGGKTRIPKDPGDQRIGSSNETDPGYAKRSRTYPQDDYIIIVQRRKNYEKLQRQTDLYWKRRD